MSGPSAKCRFKIFVVMTKSLLVTALLTTAVGVGASAQSRDAILKRATAYVTDYEQAFSVLVSEERYVQEIRRPIDSGSNLSRINPGGGIQGGNTIQRLVLRSDYLLVQVGSGGGWMPFRDVFEVNDAKVRDREDRLAKLFLSNDASRFDQADRIMAESTRHNLGSVTRTINIPVLALMLLHPSVVGRFEFDVERREMVSGVESTRVSYRESTRPTLIKTTRGRDLALTGTLWIDGESGAVVKTALVAADPALRASIEVTFRREDALKIWVPSQMDETYLQSGSSNEIVATATYSNVRRFQVNTNEKLTKPPGPGEF